MTPVETVGGRQTNKKKEHPYGTGERGKKGATPTETRVRDSAPLAPETRVRQEAGTTPFSSGLQYKLKHLGAATPSCPFHSGHFDRRSSNLMLGVPGPLKHLFRVWGYWLHFRVPPINTRKGKKIECRYHL